MKVQSTKFKVQSKIQKLKTSACGCGLICSLLVLNGCGAYKFNYGKKPYEGGYVVSRRGYAIPEYTIGKNNSAPGQMSLAKQRFKRRRGTVEHYYKKMGFVTNGLKQFLLDYPSMSAGFITGIFRLPFAAIADYKYEHNPKYRKKIDELDRQQEEKERGRIKKLKDELADYVQKDLDFEAGKQANAAKQAIEKKILPAQEKKTIQEKTLVKISGQDAQGLLEVVIIAKPTKGYSPLFVRFYGNKSRSKQHKKIVSYSWDFGDTDTSDLANPVNTYYSNLLEPAIFNVSLAVKDSDGNTASVSAAIEVFNK